MNALADTQNLLLDQTYVHSNGFIKISFLENGALKRYHIWNSRVFPTKATENTPHNHPWCFSSRVIAGEFGIRFFEECPASAPEFCKYLCSAHRVPGRGHEFSVVEKAVGLKQVFSAALVKGCSYSQDASVIHTIEEKSGAYGATLIEFNSERARDSLVYSRGQAPTVVENTPIGADKVQELIQELEGAIACR